MMSSAGAQCATRIPQQRLMPAYGETLTTSKFPQQLMRMALAVNIPHWLMTTQGNTQGGVGTENGASREKQEDGMKDQGGARHGPTNGSRCTATKQSRTPRAPAVPYPGVVPLSIPRWMEKRSPGTMRVLDRQAIYPVPDRVPPPAAVAQV